MRLQLLALGLLGGCAGVYAEVAASKLTSASISPSSGDSIDVKGASTVSLNLGVELGSLGKRFAIGYLHDAVSYDQGSGTLAGSSTRFDFNVAHVLDRLSMRIGLGFEFGSGDSTYAGQVHTASSGGGAFAGVDATYFLTWKNALHVFVGARFISQQTSAGNFGGYGPTVRVTLSHTFGDTRPDQVVVIPLSNSRDIIGVIEVGSSAVGCTTLHQSHGNTAAMLDVTCPGDHHLEYIQIAEGIVVTCLHEISESSCRALNTSIVDAAARKVKAAAPPEDPVPPPAPPAPPAPPTPEPAPPVVEPSATP